jgi:hypothetical protein
MKFTCRFENRETGELKDLISTLDPDEIAILNGILLAEGEEIAQVTAAAIVLKSAYRDLDPHQWIHLNAPALLLLN